MIASYGSFPNGPGYLIFQGLQFNGNNAMASGINCNGGHHIKSLSNTFTDFGEAGFMSTSCDYMDVEHNTVFHSGYNQGWSSGIDIGLLKAFDSYSGFHNIMAFNIVSGEYDNSSNHTDGNGFNVDDGTNVNSSDPATLIVGNVSYGNGGRSFECDACSNVWWVNNTSYSSGLDTQGLNGQVYNGELQINRGVNDHLVNNLFYSYNNHLPINFTGSPTGLACSSNITFGASSNTLAGFCTTGFTMANPNYISPTTVSTPAYVDGNTGQYNNAISPSSLGNMLDLQSNSSAYGAGVDPTTLTTDANQKSDMSNYVYLDINGNSRPVGGSFTVGAYQQ